MARTTGSSGPKTLEAIRTEGLRLIAEHGYEAMSLRQLAAEVGIQAGSLYNHIRTKQDLLFQLIKGHMDALIPAFDATVAGIDDPVERLQAFVAFHVNYHIVRARDVFVANFELRSLEPANYATIVELRRQYEARVQAIVDAGVAQGAFEVADSQVATFAILTMLTGVCTWYRPGGRLSKERVIEIHTKLVLDGLLSGRERPAPAGRGRARGKRPAAAVRRAR